MRTLKGEIEKKRYEKLMKEWKGVTIQGDYSWEHYYPGKVIEEIFSVNDDVTQYAIDELRYNLLTGDKKMGESTKYFYECDNMCCSHIWKWVSTLKRIGLIK